MLSGTNGRRFAGEASDEFDQNGRDRNCSVCRVRGGRGSDGGQGAGPESAAAAPPAQLGALAPANLAKPRPKPPFDLTGTWQHDGRANTWKFVPETFKLTPQAQVHFEAGQKALKAGGVYRDDIGQCWPAGMPLIMTRVWPIAMVQLPTAIYMISALRERVRIIYLDGRPHTPADVVVRTFNGESIGHWEGDALVVDTIYFPGHHHWMDQGAPRFR